MESSFRFIWKENTNARYWLIILGLITCLSLFNKVQAQITCTVNSMGGGDFTTLESALVGCRSGSDTNITLVISGTFDVGRGGLVFPTDIENITIQGNDGNPVNAVITGSCYSVDLTSPFPSINFLNVTFNFNDTDSPLFCPQLTNQNLTIYGSIFENASIPTGSLANTTTYLIFQEACIDNVFFTLINNTFNSIPSGIYHIQGVAGFNIQQNFFPNCGANVTANQSMAYIKLSGVADSLNFFNQNDQYQCFQCREIRCLYAIFNDSYEFQCNNGALQCIDRVNMDQEAAKFPDLCPVGDYTVVDRIDGKTITITNDYNPECTQYISCPCNPVMFQNTTSGLTFTLPVGNIILKTGQLLPCVPAPGLAAIVLPADIIYLGPGAGIIVGDPFANPPIGVPATQLKAMTPLANGSFVIFAEGVIINPNTNSTTCSCAGSGAILARDPLEVACEYLIVPDNETEAHVNSTLGSLLNGPAPTVVVNGNDTVSIPFEGSSWIPSFCEEGTMFCCAQPHQFQVIYKAYCSLYPNQCSPAVFPNDTVVNTFQQKYYDCEYLSNCTYSPGGITGCNSFRCGLVDCMIGVRYATSDMCFTRLNLGTSDTEIDTEVFDTQSLTLSFDGSGNVNTGSFINAISSLPGGRKNVNITIAVGNVVTSSTGDLYVATLVGGFLYSATITNALLSNGSTISVVNFIGANDPQLHSVSIVSGTLTTSLFEAPYPQCDDYSIATTDPMCLFARQHCYQYYDGNYPSSSYVLNGHPTGTNQTQLSKACSFDPDYCVFFNDSRCLCADCTLSSCRLGITYNITDACYPILPATCNNLSIPSTDPLCTFLRDDCLRYYDPNTGLLLMPSNYQLPTICPLNTTGTVPINESQFFNITPPACEFYPGNCLSYLEEVPGSTFDDRCNCTVVTNLTILTGTPSGFIDFGIVLGAIITSDTSRIPPSKVPVFLVGERLNVTALNCTTDLWFPCACPPYYTYNQSVPVCLPSGASNCTWQSLTVQQCIDDANCSLPAPPSLYSFYFGQVPLTCATADDSMHCDCGAYLASMLCPPAPGSVTYQFDAIPDAAQLQIIDNSACWHWNSLLYRHTSVIPINAVTTEPQPFLDEYSLLRNTQAQKNEFLKGTQGDIVQNSYGSLYRRECTGGCYADYRAPSTQELYECIIDATTDIGLPGYGVIYFSSVYQALEAIQNNGSCQSNKTVLINYIQQYYQEPEDFVDNPTEQVQLIFGSACNNFVFASLDGAVIVGSNFGIDPRVTNLTFVGLHFQHPGEGNQPLFSLSPHGGLSISLLTYYDCIFDGHGASKSGILDISRLYNLDMRYCLIQNWNYFGIRILNANRITFYDNTIINCEGRCLQFRFNYFVRFEGNVFIDSRGGSGLKGVSIVMLRASNTHACNRNTTTNANGGFNLGDAYLDLIAGGSSSGNLPITQDLTISGSGSAQPHPYSLLSMTSNWTRLIPQNETFLCAVRRNVHITDPLQADFTDTFILMSGGSATTQDILDNSVYKVQFGMQFLFTVNIGSVQDQDFLARFNPLVKPTLFRFVDPSNGVFAGADFRGFGYAQGNSGSFTFLGQSSQFMCNFPCSATQEQLFVHKILQCIVNDDFDTETMPVYDQIAGSYHLGYYQFHNVSQAATFCIDFNMIDGLLMPLIRVTTYNGSRYYVDNITLDRDAWLLGDTSAVGTWCTIEKGFRPCVRGEGSTCQTGRCRMSNMCFELGESLVGGNLWQTGDPIPYDFEIYNCIFDGRSVDPRGTAFAIYAQIGQEFSVNLDQSPQNNSLPSESNGTFSMYNSSVQNFTSFAPTPVNNQGNVIVLSSFPFTTGVQVQFVNYLNTNTSCFIVNNTFINIDRTAIAVSGPINATVTFNKLLNVSGRSEGNVASFYFEGNPYYSNSSGVSNLNFAIPLPISFYNISFNYGDQNKTILTPFDARKANLVRLTSMWIRMVSANATLCIRGNSMRDLPLGLRLSDMNQTVLQTCLTPPNKIYFGDQLRYIRAIANELQCTVPPNTSLPFHTPPPPPLPPGFWGILGSYHDIEFSFDDATLELYENVLVCDGCCLPIPPPICYVEPPGVDQFFVPTHPWFGIYIFTSINDCLNLCNATSRTCQLVGDSDPLGAFVPFGQPIPFKTFTETIGTILGPNPNVNQSNTTTLRGESGLVVCAPGSHYLDNPLGFTVIIEGISFKHCNTGAGATWDFTDPTYDSQNMAWNGNIFNGDNSASRPIDGLFNNNIRFTGNLLTNYTGIGGARFTAKNCTSKIFINKDTFINFVGNNLDVIGFNYITVGSGLGSGNNNYANSFINAGGSNLVPSTERWVLRVSTCADGLPGNVKVSGNRVQGSLSVTCFVPFWTGIYIDPVPWYIPSPYSILTPIDTKSFTISQDVVNLDMCTGLRLNNVPYNCFAADEQGFLREEIYFKGRNVFLEGRIFWLFIGPFNAAYENAVLAAPLVNGQRCKHCEKGCPRSSIDTLAWIVGGILLGLFLCLFCICVSCPGVCFCCPVAPTTWHQDSVLGQQVPDDQSTWLTFIRYAPVLNSGRPWKSDEPKKDEGALYNRRIRSVDEANVHNRFTGWAGALNEDNANAQ